MVSAVQAASCVYDASNELKPNRSYNFDVVLDVSESAAVVVFDPVRTAAGNGPPRRRRQPARRRSAGRLFPLVSWLARW